MKAKITALAGLVGCLVCYLLLPFVRADAPATTQSAAGVATGEIDLTFTDRSPLSKPEELERRLVLKTADVSPDYDLSKCPFKAYVPTNYSESTPVGLFVYLGYKDTVGTPPLWHPLLEKYHMIFVSPVCHSGEQYAPAVPKWESLGLAFDAVENLKKQYSVDPHRIYMMSWAKDSTRISLAAGDVFTGFVVVGDPSYCVRMMTTDGRFYSPEFLPPPGELIIHAKDSPFLFIYDGSLDPEMVLKVATMRRGGFAHVKSIGLSFGDDLHFPNLKAEWFDEQAMSFLDKSEASNAGSPNPGATTTASTKPAAPVNQPEHLLSMAKILLANGQTSLAKKKLEQIVEVYPRDPAAEEAKKLLQQLNNP